MKEIKIIDDVISSEVNCPLFNSFTFKGDWCKNRDNT